MSEGTLRTVLYDKTTTGYCPILSYPVHSYHLGIIRYERTDGHTHLKPTDRAIDLPSSWVEWNAEVFVRGWTRFETRDVPLRRGFLSGSREDYCCAMLCLSHSGDLGLADR